jgi:hypothetical protein
MVSTVRPPDASISVVVKVASHGLLALPGKHNQTMPAASGPGARLPAGLAGGAAVVAAEAQPVDASMTTVSRHPSRTAIPVAILFIGSCKVPTDPPLLRAIGRVNADDAAGRGLPLWLGPAPGVDH